MAKKNEKKGSSQAVSSQAADLERKMALLKFVCVVGAGILASLAMWWFSK
ncbi:MAG: hypothetical protein JXB25_00885 [Deltaproteobacteria bacterium]|nr:hypothetical protein [Deltaproteobacteria bacterium]